MSEQISSDIFDTASAYYQKNPLNNLDHPPEYLELSKNLEFIIDSAPFLSESEKSRLKKLLSIFPFKTLEQLKIELIKEGITYHQNHQSDKKMLRWLKLVIQNSKAIKN